MLPEEQEKIAHESVVAALNDLSSVFIDIMDNTEPEEVTACPFFTMFIETYRTNRELGWSHKKLLEMINEVEETLDA